MTTTQSFKILYVCSGNISPSVLAEAYTACYVESHEGAVPWEIRSAGINAVEGDPARAELAAAADSFGLDLSAHRARPLTRDMLSSADLVLAMSWEEASHIWSMAPESWGTSFTIREFVHWVRQTPPRPGVLFPDKIARMRDRVEQAHAIRRRARADHGFWGGLRPQDLNVTEPEGKGDPAWRSFAKNMRALVVDVVHLVGGP